jgi:hypothetical protein
VTTEVFQKHEKAIKHANKTMDFPTLSLFAMFKK